MGDDVRLPFFAELTRLRPAGVKKLCVFCVAGVSAFASMTWSAHPLSMCSLMRFWMTGLSHNGQATMIEDGGRLQRPRRVN